MKWALDHHQQILTYALQHIYLAGMPLLVGLALAIPLGWAARRSRLVYTPLVAVSGLLYTIPSLALFILLPGILHRQILDPVNVLVAMTLYTLALLVRTVADGLGSVPSVVVQAATAMGYKSFARFFRVELPLAVPVIAAGLRVAAVSNVSIVSVASLIGVSQLGFLLTDGYNVNFPTELIVGIASCVVLALVFDLLIVILSKLMTPWTRVAGGRA